jgi:hypothetical protein
VETKGQNQIFRTHDAMSADFLKQNNPYFAGIDEFGKMTGLSRRKIYDLMADKKLIGHKLGARVLIDVNHGLQFLRSLPLAEVKPQTRRRADAWIDGGEAG